MRLTFKSTDLSKADYLRQCGWHSPHRLSALTEERRTSPEGAESAERLSTSSAAASTLPLVAMLPAYPADWGRASIHNWRESSNINLSLSLSYWRPDVITISTFSSSPKETLCPLTVTPHCPSSPVPGNLNLVCASMYFPVPHISHTWNHRTVASCDCLLSQGTTDSRSIVLLPISVFWFLPATFPPVDTRGLLLFHSPATGAASPFWQELKLPLWTCVSKLRMDDILISLGYIPDDRCAGSHGNSLILWRPSETSSKQVYATSHSH